MTFVGTYADGIDADRFEAMPVGPLAALPPLSAGALASHASVDPVPLGLSVLAAGAYLAGTRRLRRRGRHWKTARTLTFLAGIVAILLATQSGLAAYDTTLFSAHVAQHVLLGIVAPVLMALGAPVTLALQACHRPTQVNLLRLLHSRVVAVLTHPVVAWFVFGATLFVLYFSPLYELSLRNGVVHAWVHLHFLVAGSLFAWATVGIDPVAGPVSYGLRLVLVLFTVPFHAFLGLALTSSTEPLAAGWYVEQARTWGPSLLDDQRIGAALMWIVGDLMGVIVSGIVLQQWWRAEARRTERLDRRADAEAVAT